MYKRNGVFWANLRFDGRRVQRSLGTSDRKLAKSIESKIRAEMVEGKFFDKPVGSQKTFKNMLDRLMWEHVPKVSVGMQRNYRGYCKVLLDFFKADTRLNQITAKTISAYKVKRYDDGIMAATINKELSCLSKAFNLSIRQWEWLKENPVSKAGMERVDNARDRWLSCEEERALLENCPEWLREIIIFDLNTGLRRNELLSLKWDKVDLFRKVIIIQETKNGKPRTIPLTKSALDILIEKSKVINLKTALVFCNADGGKICRSKLRRHFVEAVNRAGIKDFKFHDLRHTLATRLAQAGVDIYKISKLLGHLTIAMTQRYSHHSPESLRSGIEVLEGSGYNLATPGENRGISNA